MLPVRRFNGFSVSACLSTFRGISSRPWRHRGRHHETTDHETVTTTTEPGKYHDGDAGLYLYVQAAHVEGGRDDDPQEYLQRLTIRREAASTSGSAPRSSTTLERGAGEGAREPEDRPQSGATDRRNPAAVPTFAEGIEAVLALQRPNWRDGGKSEKQWRASLRDYAGPLMTKRVDAIDGSRRAGGGRPDLE